MSFLDRFRTKKEDEPARVKRLLKTGRIVDGEIIDVTTDQHGRVQQVFYVYSVAGAEYQSCHSLSAEQQSRDNHYTVGTPTTVRYDPRQPGNSIVV